MLTSRRVFNLTVALATAAIGVAAYLAVGPSSASAKGVTRTSTVTRGVVLSSVTATGNVGAANQLSLSFITGGILTEVDVAAGQHVDKGQVLGRVDSRTQQASLDSAQASLTSAQAKLFVDAAGATPQVIAQDQAAANQAQIAVTNANTAVANAQANAAQDVTTQQNTVNQAKQAAAGLPSTASQSQIDQANNAVTNALNAQQAAALKDQQAITVASQQLTSAQASQQNTLAANAAKEAPPLANVLDADKAQVTSAQSQVLSARIALDGTTLTAPMAGTVTAVNGRIGQSANGSSSSSSASSSGTAAGGSGGAGSSTASTGSAGSGFVSLTDLSSLQVVAGYSETDAAKVKVGQPATVSLNALPNQTLQGTVAQVDTTSTVVSNVVTYNVTIAVTDPPAAVKPGMTASVAVTSSEKDNVLALPASVVPTRGTTATLQVITSDGKSAAKSVVIGLRGDSSVEIVSGLNVGDKVATTTTAAAGGTPTARLPGVGGGLGGGLGGGRVGG